MLSGARAFVNGEDIHVHFFSSYISLQGDGGCSVFNGPQHPPGQLPKSIPELSVGIFV